MSKVSKDAYLRLIAQDLNWLQQLPDSLEKTHTETIIRMSDQFFYGDEPATGSWQTGEPPKDEKRYLCDTGESIFVAFWQESYISGNGCFKTHPHQIQVRSKIIRYAIINK